MATANESDDYVLTVTAVGVSGIVVSEPIESDFRILNSSLFGTATNNVASTINGELQENSSEPKSPHECPRVVIELSMSNGPSYFSGPSCSLLAMPGFDKTEVVEEKGDCSSKMENRNDSSVVDTECGSKSNGAIWDQPLAVGRAFSYANSLAGSTYDKTNAMIRAETLKRKLLKEETSMKIVENFIKSPEQFIGMNNLHKTSEIQCPIELNKRPPCENLSQETSPLYYPTVLNISLHLIKGNERLEIGHCQLAIDNEYCRNTVLDLPLKELKTNDNSLSGDEELPTKNSPKDRILSEEKRFSDNNCTYTIHKRAALRIMVSTNAAPEITGKKNFERLRMELLQARQRRIKNGMEVMKIEAQKRDSWMEKVFPMGTCSFFV